MLTCVTFAFQRVSKRFAERLETEFWPDIQSIIVRFFSYSHESLPMTIGSENYESIDTRPLKNFKRRGIQRSMIIFGEDTPKDFVLPMDFAISGMLYIISN